MRQRRQLRRDRLFPILGLLTVIILAAFVYVSYTADSGLPFTASYRITARVPNADRLIPTDEVRIAGIRVGQVSSVDARVGGGNPYAVIGMALSPKTGPLPVDTRVEVQSSSVLGQTYVDLVPGHSAVRVRDGGILPITDARSAVELTDLFEIFDHATARSIQDTIGGFGYGLAGRGPDLNETLAGLPRLLPAFASVSRTLAAPQTRLADFLRGWEAFAGALVPVARPLGDLMRAAGGTFGALDAKRRALGQTIGVFPGAEAAATEALNRLHAPLDQLAALTVRLRSAGALLPATVERINTTLSAGVAAVRTLPGFSAVLDRTLADLDAVSKLPTTPGALRQMTSLLAALRPLLAVLTPAQLDCNIAGLYGRNFSSAWGTIGNGIGPSYVVAGVVTSGAQGEGLQAAAPASNLHINYLPHEDAGECESGNEPFNASQQDLSNPPGNQSRSVPRTSPPPGVTALAERAGLLTPPPGTPR